MFLVNQVKQEGGHQLVPPANRQVIAADIGVWLLIEMALDLEQLKPFGRSLRYKHSWRLVFVPEGTAPPAESWPYRLARLPRTRLTCLRRRAIKYFRPNGGTADRAAFRKIYVIHLHKRAF
mgnify:CR=1 FL=1